MNVALFTDSYLPVKSGVVTHVKEITDGLRRKGHRVCVVTSAHPGYVESDRDVLRLQSVKAPLGHGTEIYYSYGSQRTVEDFLRSRNIDVVHAHTEFALGRSGKKAARRFGVPLVHTFHTLWEEYVHYVLGGRVLKPAMVRRIVRRFLRGVDGVIAPSVKIADYLHTVMPGLSTTIISNGIDVERISSLLPSPEARLQLRERLGFREGDVVIAFVGRIGIEKRVFQPLDVASAAVESDPRLRFLVVGDGPALPTLMRAAASGPASRAIRFTEAIPWESVIPHYAVADAFISLSLSEVQPMTVIEALACGLPIIARRDACYTGLVQDGVNGFLVDQDQEAVGRMLELARDRALRERCARASRDLSRQVSVERTVSMLERYYAESIARRAGGRARRSA
jgi:1,2-diacylglycerol 3-alpha-glucosyltransferase